MTDFTIIETNANPRDVLLALLQDMNTKLERAPAEVDLSELQGMDLHFLLVTCCADMITNSICAVSKNRADALLGLESLVESMRKHIEEHTRDGRAN
jgi:hypothetical protein